MFASRQCADYVRASYAGAGEVRVACVMFAVQSRRSRLVFVVSKPRWPRCAVVPDLHFHRQRSCRPHIWVKHIWMCQTVWHTYGLYVWYVTTLRMTFLNVTHNVRMYIRTLWE